MPSKATINRHIVEYGTKPTEFLREHLAGTVAQTVLPDGTPCPSQDDNEDHHTVSVTLCQRDADETRILDDSFNELWGETAAAIDETDAIANQAAVVSDAEENLLDAFVDDKRIHQLDLLHLGRTIEYYLWKDNQFPLEERTEYVEEVKDIVFHLKNSVAKHDLRREYWELHDRIERTREQLEQLARNSQTTTARTRRPTSGRGFRR